MGPITQLTNANDWKIALPTSNRPTHILPICDLSPRIDVWSEKWRNNNTTHAIYYAVKLKFIYFITSADAVAEKCTTVSVSARLVLWFFILRFAYLSVSHRSWLPFHLSFFQNVWMNAIGSDRTFVVRAKRERLECRMPSSSSGADRQSADNSKPKKYHKHYRWHQK